MEGDQHIAKSLPKMSTEDLLEMIRAQVNPGSASSTAAPANTQADEAPDEEASDDGSSSHEGLTLQERLRQVKKRQKAKAETHRRTAFCNRTRRHRLHSLRTRWPCNPPQKRNHGRTGLTDTKGKKSSGHTPSRRSQSPLRQVSIVCSRGEGRFPTIPDYTE